MTASDYKVATMRGEGHRHKGGHGQWKRQHVHAPRQVPAFDPETSHVLRWFAATL